MSEEMKMILALIDYLNLQIKATGNDQDSTLVSGELFTKGAQYTYTVSVKP